MPIWIVLSGVHQKVWGNQTHVLKNHYQGGQLNLLIFYLSKLKSVAPHFLMHFLVPVSEDNSLCMTHYLLMREK